MSARSNSRRAQMSNKALSQEKGRLKLHEQLAQFQLFNESTMPMLQKMVLENWPADKIRRAFAPLIQAKMIQECLKGNVKAMKDTLDRTEGTAVQRQETITRYGKMDKAEMAALALQKLIDAGLLAPPVRKIKDVE